MLRSTSLIATAAMLSASCATLQQHTDTAVEVRGSIAPFSANPVAAGQPLAWKPWIITRAKASTQYELIRDPETNAVVLRAHAIRSATGLMQRLGVDPTQHGVVAWKWKFSAPITNADLEDRHADDAPARLLLFFDGDEATLSPRERMLRETARVLSGQAVPYATLIYVWDRHREPGTVLPHPISSQIKRVVVSNPDDRLGKWKRFERSYVDDYRRAYGADPGRLIGVGILTDTDNTGGEAHAYYGDIVLGAGRL